jgi:spore maturation protein CgeB
MNIVILGLSITSSWGNGHATTYRSLVKGLSKRGHSVLFLERDREWYAANRDLPEPPFGRTCLYHGLPDLRRRFTRDVKLADLVIVGSYVPEGVAVAEWVLCVAQGATAFYDIDTPVTLAKLNRGDFEYISPLLIPRFDLYLSFTGGPTLRCLEQKFRAVSARALYCSVDEELYDHLESAASWDLGYLGTYSEDRQPALDSLLLKPAAAWARGRFCVAGPLYPPAIQWPPNVCRREHLAPSEHPCFYNSQRFTLNITRADMLKAGYSPSVRLFEAGACGAAVITDSWPGLEDFFSPGQEVLVARSGEDVLSYLNNFPEAGRRKMAARLRERILGAHTGVHRAIELESYVASLSVVAPTK